MDGGHSLSRSPSMGTDKGQKLTLRQAWVAPACRSWYGGLSLLCVLSQGLSVLLPDVIPQPVRPQDFGQGPELE